MSRLQFFYRGIPNKLRFGTGILEREASPWNSHWCRSSMPYICMSSSADAHFFPEIVGICARITRRTYLEKHLSIRSALTPHWFTPGSRFFLHMVLSGNGHACLLLSYRNLYMIWFDPNSWQEQNIHSGGQKLQNMKSSNGGYFVHCSSMADPTYNKQNTCCF